MNKVYIFLIIALIGCSTSDRVDFDGFYINGRLNNQPEEVSMIVDTGAPPTLISQSLAKSRKKYSIT